MASDDRLTQPPLLPSRLDVGVAFLAGIVQIGGTYLAGGHQVHPRQWGVLGLILLGAGPALLVVRRRWPVAVLATTFATTLAYSTIGYVQGPIWIGLIVAFANAVMTGHRRAAQASLVAGYFGFLWLRPALGRESGPSAVAALGLLAWLLLLLSVAEVIRSRRDRAVHVARSREEEAERRAGEERLRIAREVHDLVAHNMSLINVQASTALHLMGREPDRARVALETIKAASKDALAELRSVLGVLRHAQEGAPLAPTPGVGRLDELVTAASAAGLTVDVIVGGACRSLAPTVDLAAYRIVQEALTNTTRHAHARSATVRLVYGVGDLVVQIDDDGRADPSGAPTGAGGHGLAGMRERATILGGTLAVGPRPEGGGFRVRAWLPAEGGGV